MVNVKGYPYQRGSGPFWDTLEMHIQEYALSETQFSCDYAQDKNIVLFWVLNNTTICLM